MVYLNPNSTQAVFSISVILLIAISCRKVDQNFNATEIQNKGYTELKKQFFNTSAADPEVQKVAEDIEKQDSIFKFLPEFVKKNGIPKWDKVLYKVSKTGSQNNQRSAASNTENRSISTSKGESQALFLIPLQSSTSSDVKSYISAYKHNDSLYTYRLYNRDSLNSVKATTSQTKSNLLNLQAVFGYFEKSINNKDSIDVLTPAKGRLRNVRINLEDSVQKKANTNRNSLDLSTSSTTVESCSMLIIVTTYYEWRDFTYCYEGCGEWLVVAQTTEVLTFCDGSGGGGGCNCGGGTGSGDDSYWWLYGTGYPYYSTGGPSGYLDPHDPNWYPWWTGDGSYTGGSSGFSTTIDYLTSSLGLSWNQSFWLSQNEIRADEINNFIANSTYDALTHEDKQLLAKTHLDKMMFDSDYLDMVNSFSLNNSLAHPWMIELFKELAIEIGFRIVKKYLPGYGDWQSINDAIKNGAQGDWIGMLGEILNIVKKRVPWLAAVDAVIDAFDLGSLANKSWKVFDKLSDLPPSAAKGLIKTVKEKCGDILEKIEIDPSSSQGFGRILYNPNDAPSFFDDLARNITGNFPNSFTPQNGGIGKYFDFQGVKFNFYTIPTTSGAGPTIEIIFPNGFTYKIRFE